MDMFDGYSVEELTGISDRCSEITRVYSELYVSHTLFPSRISEGLESTRDILDNLNMVVKSMIRVIDARDVLGEEPAKTILLTLRSELAAIYSTLYDKTDSNFYHYIVVGKK